MLLELLEWHCDRPSTAIRAQDAQRDWHQRLGSGVHADAIMDCIVHNTLWVEIDRHNMREHTAAQVAAQTSRDGASLAPTRATAWRPEAIPVAPEGNIRWPPHLQILTAGRLELFADLHQLIHDHLSKASGRAVRGAGSGVQRSSRLVDSSPTDLVEHASRDFQRAAEPDNRQCVRLGGVVVHDRGTSLG